MNFKLPFIPERPAKPRNSGLTMMMDKGLSLSETEHFIEANKELTDIVKFGFGTAYVTNNLEEKSHYTVKMGLDHILVVHCLKRFMREIKWKIIYD